MKKQEVHLGRGLGPLLFGISMKEAMGLMGGPPDDERDEDGSRLLEYGYRGTALFFHAEEGDRLSGIEVDSVSGALLFGRNVFQMGRLEVTELLRSEQGDAMDDASSVVHLDPFGTRLTVRPLSLDLYFDSGNRLVEIHWGPFIDSAGDFIWPDHSGQTRGTIRSVRTKTRTVSGRPTTK